MNPTWSADRTKPNWRAIQTKPNGTLWQGFDTHGSVACTVQSADKPATFLSVCVFYLSISIVKDHQTVEPNAKCTILCNWYTKTEHNQTTVRIRSNWTKPKPWQNSNWTKPNPNLDPDRTKTELLSVSSISITRLIVLGNSGACVWTNCLQSLHESGLADNSLSLSSFRRHLKTFLFSFY